MPRILIVEDDAAVANLMKDTLEAEFHDVELAYSGDDGLLLLERFDFDLLVLDWELPNLSGIEICDSYRKRGGMAPVIFVTARGELDDKEKGFQTGADDYLLKPFQMRELALRAQALLRRPKERSDDTIHYRDLLIEPRKGSVRKNEKDVRLQPREMALLEFLARNKGLVFSSSALIDRVWKTDTEATDISVRGCIARLRKKLNIQDGEPFIENLRGLGYRLPEDSSK